MASSSYFHFFALVVTLLGLASSGEAIRCFECNSLQDYSCGDPFHSRRSPLIDCDRKNAHNTYLQQFSVCKKVVTRVNGEYQVERSCAWSRGYGDNPCPRDTSYAVTEHCSVCTTDACNGASGLIPTVWTSLLITSVFYIGAKYL